MSGYYVVWSRLPNGSASIKVFKSLRAARAWGMAKVYVGCSVGEWFGYASRRDANEDKDGAKPHLITATIDHVTNLRAFFEEADSARITALEKFIAAEANSA